MPSARRTSSCGSERRNSSATKPPRERPTTIWVTFSNREKRRISPAISFAHQRPRLGSQGFGELQSAVDPALRGFVSAAARLLDGDGDPRRVHQVGQPLRRAHDGRRVGIAADAGEDTLARRQWPLDRLRLHALDEVGVDALGRTPQRQLAQRGQVLRLEEILARSGGRLLEVDLALGQALEELVGRQVDQHDLVGLLEHAVGHRLAHAHAGDLLHDVVEAFEVLDVECGPDVDAGRQQLVHVLPALGMTAAGDVGVGVFVDQQELRTPRERRVDVELAHDAVDVDDRLARQDLEAVEQSLGLDAPVRLDDANDDIPPFGLRGAGGDQHRVGLADARRRAEEDLETPAPLLPGARSSASGEARWAWCAGMALLGGPADLTAARRPARD